MSTATSYKNIFKSTALFGSVQIFKIITQAGINKIAALILGAEGIGVMGILNSSLNMLKTGCGLGISDSAVRDVSEAYGADDTEKFSTIIVVVNKVVLFTALLGFLITLVLSPWLSQWAFNVSQYTLSYVFLAFAVALAVYSEGQLAILKGMRRMRDLAKATVAGSAAGLIVAIPFYYIWGVGGIAPALIVVSLCSFLFSNYYVRKIKYNRQQLSLKSVFRKSKPMVTMGIALMLGNFIAYLFDIIISSYMTRHGGLAYVGYYHAGALIVGGYFGIVISAMSTDYYPRISAINKDNKLLEQELNRQSESGLVLIYPLVVLFIFLSDLFIKILYDSSFEVANQFINIALIGTIIILVSNCMGMILLAKQTTKLFLWSVICQRTVLIFIYIILYKHFGLRGLGFAYICLGGINFIVMSIFMGYFYGIHIKRRVYILLAIVISTAIISQLIKGLDSHILSYSIGGIIFIVASCFSLWFLKTRMGLNIPAIIYNRLKR